MANVFKIILVTCLFLSCNAPIKTTIKKETYSLNCSDIVGMPLLETEHFRGLFINEQKAYLAGSKGTVIYYNFETKQFVLDTTFKNKAHFRDIHFVNQTLYLMGIQQPSILIIQKQGVSDFTFENKDSLSFFDGIDFWKNGNGLLFGDPLNNVPYVVKICNDSIFERVEKNQIPELELNEAGFAASGTSVVCVGDGVGYIGWGGDEVRIFKTTNYGENWTVQPTPFPKHQTGTGIYSMAFKDQKNGVAVGGNWEFAACDSSKIYTHDGGQNWHLAKGLQQYRSCVTHLKDNSYIATGTNGTDISYDGGETWEFLDSIGFNSIQFNNNDKGIGVGNFGQIKLLQLHTK